MASLTGSSPTCPCAQFANVLVSGLGVIASAGKIDRRSRFILALSLGVGIGVTAVPEVRIFLRPHSPLAPCPPPQVPNLRPSSPPIAQFVDGGGISTFYAENARFNMGLIPARRVCKTFPTVEVEVEKAKCKFYDHEDKDYLHRSDISKSLCKKIDGEYTEAKYETREDRDCVNNSGFCCVEYDESTKMWRDALILVLKVRAKATGPLRDPMLTVAVPLSRRRTPSAPSSLFC